MAQWVKHPTAAAQVAAEAWVLFLAQGSGLKDPVWLPLWLGFSPWPGTFHMLQGQPLKTNKQTNKKKSEKLEHLLPAAGEN